MKPDLALLHAPSVYDFRALSIMYGPVADLVPSTPIFEMYPIGFTSIAEYLERNGFRVRIINLAVRMLESPRFHVGKFLKNLDAGAYGVDLHWLPHAHGSIEVAKLIKKHHPGTPVIIGGLSSTYFHIEIMQAHPEIDFIIRGDSSEEPVLLLMKTLDRTKHYMNRSIKKWLERIPNLTWRDGKKIRANPISHVPDSLDHLMLDYSVVVKSVLRHGDLSSIKPVKDWLRYPIIGICHVRGCTQNCATCGGSAYAYKNFYCREKPAFRSPEKIVADIAMIQQFSKGPVYIIGDIRLQGDEFASRLLSLLAKERIRNQVVFELFKPAPESFFRQISHSVDNFNVSISPESHDETVRMKQGRMYTTKTLEDTIEGALKQGAERFDVFFMIGIPGQDYECALRDAEYSERLLERLGKSDRLHMFTSPLAPFIDPGSVAFENPEKMGYNILCRDFTAHRNRLVEPSWKHTLNYETKWMSRDDIVNVTYECALKFNSLKERFGFIDRKTAEMIRARVKTAVSIMKRLDRIKDMKNPTEKKLREEIDHVKSEILCSKKELEWESGGLNLNPRYFMKFLLGVVRGG